MKKNMKINEGTHKRLNLYRVHNELRTLDEAVSLLLDKAVGKG